MNNLQLAPLKHCIHAVKILAGLLLASCACQIQPPPTVVGTDKEGAAKIAAGALPSAISNAAVSGNYKSVVNTTYVTVGQDDVAFYLLLQAYNCESRRGHRDQAAILLQTAREELARRHNVAPPPTQVAATSRQLTTNEHKILRRSLLKPAITQQLTGTGVTSTAVSSPSPSPSASPGRR